MLHPYVNVKSSGYGPPCPNHRPCLEIHSLDASPDILWNLQLLSKHAPKGDPGKPVICFLKVNESKCQRAPLV